ncbi:MAG: type II toxin-antitoxin system RelE/ParE family toxin [Rhizomicrobium sp.]
MASPRFILSEDADADLRGLDRYIADRDGAGRARFVVSRILRTVANLAAMPRMGRPKPYLEPGVLSFSVRPWMIFYRILPEGDGIRVMRILDGRRDLPTVFVKNP